MTQVSAVRPMQAKSPSVTDLKARIAELEAKLTAKRTISMKVSEKGGLSVYGLGRFPVTLYRGQWERLLAPEVVAAIGAFIAANAGELTVKE